VAADCIRRHLSILKSMNRRLKLWIVSVISILTIMVAVSLYQHSLMYVRNAPEDRHGLWMATLKGIGGTPRYVGSHDDYSYFLLGEIFCSRYKAPTEKIRLPKTFPLGKGEPYTVNIEMVPKYH
jgi:hypothetical protein